MKIQDRCNFGGLDPKIPEAQVGFLVGVSDARIDVLTDWYEVLSD